MSSYDASAVRWLGALSVEYTPVLRFKRWWLAVVAVANSADQAPFAFLPASNYRTGWHSAYLALIAEPSALRLPVGNAAGGLPVRTAGRCSNCWHRGG